MRPPTFQIERKSTLGDLAAQRVALLQLVEMGRQRALWHQLNEKLERFFIRRGHDGVRPFDTLVAKINAERCILSRLKLEWPSGVHTNPPQVFRKIPPLNDRRRIVFVGRRNHPCPPLPILSSHPHSPKPLATRFVRADDRAELLVQLK